MTRRTIVLLVLATGCGESAAGSGPPTDAGTAADALVDAAPNACADAGVPPSTLECAGLYSDFAKKTVAPNVHPYTPAVPLWSDGAEKQRWIELPPGQKIDASDPNEWVFPVGTKVFKQFSYGGRRVETRLFQKVATNEWDHATYKWNATETATTISYGESVATPAGAWLIPSPQDCDACHHGRSDRILGFEAVNLGLPGADGYTLGRLVQLGLVTPAPSNTTLVIGDDGTGLDAPALAWLHVNCGVTCHNANEGASGFGAGMRLRLDPRWLDGNAPNATWDPIATTVGVPCTGGSFGGQPRIVPGDPAGSILVQLISQRGVGMQMPPAPLSRVVDTPNVDAVKAWISALPAPPDAGSDASPDAAPEAGEDATTDAAEDASEDAGEDASSDATTSDGGTEGASPGDASKDANGEAAPDAGGDASQD